MSVYVCALSLRICVKSMYTTVYMHILKTNKTHPKYDGAVGLNCDAMDVLETFVQFQCRRYNSVQNTSNFVQIASINPSTMMIVQSKFKHSNQIE